MRGLEFGEGLGGLGGEEDVEAGVDAEGALVVGGNDLAKEMRCELGGDRAPLQAALSLTVAAARAWGLAALDAVYNGLEDPAGLEAECRQGRAFGFDGKTLIHPSQVEAANRVFSPSAEELAWARSVVDAFAAPGAADKGVLRVQGRMTERLHLAQAERVLAMNPALGQTR